MLGRVMWRNVCQVWAPRSADASSRFAGDPPQPRDHVVVDDDDAEGGVRDDHREEAERHAEHLGEGVAQSAMPGDDPGQGDRDHHQERDVSRPKKRCRATAKEASVPRIRAIPVAASSDLDGGDEGVAGAGVVDRLAEPLGRDALEGPLQGGAAVERVDRDHQQRDVDEGERDARRRREEGSWCGGRRSST